VTRLRFDTSTHVYWLADPDTGKRRRVPSVSGLKSTIYPFEGERYHVRTVADWVADRWDALAAAPPSARTDEIVKGATERLAEPRNRGTALHGYAEQLWTGTPVEVPEEYVPVVDGLAAWWRRERPTLVAAERQVFTDPDPEFGLSGYAGTFDLLVDHPRRGRGLLDLKTGREVRPEYAFQLAAYAAAETQVVDGHDMPTEPVQWLGVLHAGIGGTRLWTVLPDDRRRAEAQVDAARALKALPKPNLMETPA